MKRKGLPGLLFVSLIAVFLTGFAFPGFGAVKVGVGEAIITPPIGTEMAGYARPKPADGVHDDLFARTLIVEGDNGTSTALVTISVVHVRRDLYDAIRAGISRETGIPVQNIVVSATHTHSGPSITGAYPQTGSKPAAIEGYAKTLVDSTIASAVKAWKKRVPGKIGFGSTTVLGLGMNDRRMQYGGTHPDPQVNIIKVENAHGKLMGVAFNYGCHPSTLDLHSFKFTEDWPYYSIKGIKEKVGKDVWVAYYQSAQGDVKVGYTAELSADGAAIPTRTFEFAEYKGNMMVDPVTKALATIKMSSSADVAVAQKSFDFPARDGFRLSVAEAQKEADIAKAEMEYAKKRTDIYGPRVIDSYRAENYLAELRLGAAKQFNDPNRPKTISLFQQAVRIGDAVLVTFPCEVFSEIGLEVKQQSPIKKTFVIGLAGAKGGYLATAAEYKEEGYATLISPYAPEVEQALVNSSLELINAVATPAQKAVKK